MSTNRLNFFDPDFNPAKAANYNLLLLVSDEDFSFGIIQADNAKLLAWGSHFTLDELTDPKELQELLFAPYSKIKIAVQPCNFLLIPKPLFTPSSILDASRYLDIEQGDLVLTDELLGNSVVAVFSVSEKISISLKQRFSNLKLLFKANCWIKTIVDHLPHDYQLHLQITDQKMELLKFNDGKLQFYNHFKFHNSEELVYFSGYVLEQLGLEHDQIQLVLSGSIQENDENHIQLKSFFPNIKWFDKPLLQMPAEIKFHEIIALASLNSCE